MMCFLIVSLSAQNYTFTHGTFNSGGGHQSNSLYTVTTAVAEKFQGEISTSDYEGFLGFLFPQLDLRVPLITSIDDVPDDQGREVQIVWNKCGYDDEYAIDTYYSIWRSDEDFEMRSGNVRTQILSSKTGNFKKNGEETNIFSEPYIIVEKFRENPNKTYYWQRDRDVWTFIDEVPALQYDEYSYIASTLMDSSEVDINYSIFKVVYHDLYEYYESVPDSGYSIDNIPPDPTRATIVRNGNYMKIEWEEVEYGTFEGNRYPEINGIWYKVYASDEPYFDCDETTYLETVTDLDYDYLLTGEEKKFFKIVVSDQPEAGRSIKRSKKLVDSTSRYHKLGK